ncbi:hypothetical protein AMTRI_Chr09g17620 [Amborella trichopoda]|uniref:MLO-like protein 4 isoform X2 n=1 Tax=Amborella trichopoda TaxID=13333 RepID=UPI0005D328EC|nr:MLO-like protein 4 isoform X2 [Amborella trichopoda]|eukprot:XP_006846544.2 MLO-like protein 4 isoform X2 [Amborella trichopoda]
MGMELEVGRSLAETPTWSVATITSIMVALCFVVQRCIQRLFKWLQMTRRKALLAALEKIKEELMVFGLLSLLLGHWARWVAEICVKASPLGSRFYPCSVKNYNRLLIPSAQMGNSRGSYSVNHSVFRQWKHGFQHSHCSQGHEPFVSYESLEQLHRFLFVLAVTHSFYCCSTVILAMIKIYSWRTWEAQAKTMACQNLLGAERKTLIIKRQSTFVFHHASHPWSKNKVLIWMLCFIRQFWSSINRADYIALRSGFISNHDLPFSYDFHKYMLRSMEDEFRDTVGISWPLWFYAILCVFANIHGTNIFFWLSFIPAILILLVGTKMHHVVAQLAIEIITTDSPVETQLNPRDGLFWFGKPKLMLWLIQFISFQNAFEMATYIWSQWEMKAPSCFMSNHGFILFRVISGIIIQCWCSYVTLPQYVIIAQMGSRFKKALIAEDVRESLHGWCKRVKERSKHGSLHANLRSATSTTSLDSMADGEDGIDPISLDENLSMRVQYASMREDGIFNHHPGDTLSQSSVFSEPHLYDSYGEEEGDELHILRTIGHV